jgi:hypothetical protein
MDDRGTLPDGGGFLTVVALFGALAVQGPIAGWRRWLLLPVALVALVYPLTLATKWVQFDRRAASFRRLMHLVERGSSTLTLVQLGGDPGADKQAQPYLQFHAYAQMLAGGYDPWALDNGFPFTQRREASLPAPRWKHLETFSVGEHGVHYDYILTLSEMFDYSYHGPDDQGRAPLVGRDGDWRLYKVRH